MTSSYLEMKSALCLFAADNGLRLIQETEPASFGDRLADFDAPFGRVRLLLDRGLAYVQIAARSDLGLSNETVDWYPLEGLINFFRDPGLKSPTVEIDSADEIDLLKTYWPAIVDLFS